ncbi:hypothetical protein E5288_WYG013067 [Bos mutus]|uniref:BPTI/Kunitz inhibitor domain-containing protein n=1 Tax=Bos mutus TaxID=72004 RepID=A0A6B0RA20_9CETA|nr:hypothetical protein [Bos mutus]
MLNEPPGREKIFQLISSPYGALIKAVILPFQVLLVLLGTVMAGTLVGETSNQAQGKFQLTSPLQDKHDSFTVFMSSETFLPYRSVQSLIKLSQDIKSSVHPQHPQELSCKATKMNCLCLSAALLFLLVILVDGTPVYEHHSLDQADSQPAFCLEPKLAGSCKNKTARYFYNAKTGCCEPFVDGGCEDNKNNFNTIDNCLKSCCPDCMKTCCTLEESQGQHIKSSVCPQHPQELSWKATKMRRLCLSAALLVLLVILVDSTPLNIHHIQDEDEVMISRIQFYNHTQEELPTLEIEYAILSEENKGQVMISRIQFDNHTQEELPTLNMEYSTLNEENKVSPAFMPAFCVEPKFVGVCNASMTRYFYNAQTGHCELFVYSGCGGNENNFPTLEECMKTCYPKAQSLCQDIKSSVHPQHPQESCKATKMSWLCLSAALLFLLVILVDSTLVYTHHTQDQAASKPALCLEPKVTGGCNAMMTRYFYNAQTGLCEQFVYGGCEGNGNNFKKLEDCMKTCSQEAGSLW